MSIYVVVVASLTNQFAIWTQSVASPECEHTCVCRWMKYSVSYTRIWCERISFQASKMSRHIMLTCCVLLAMIVGERESKVSALEQQKLQVPVLPDQQLSERVEMPLNTLDANILRCKSKQRHQKKRHIRHCNYAVHKTRTFDNKSKKRQTNKKTRYSNVSTTKLIS